MKRSKVLPLILITAAAVTGIGVAGFFAIRKYNDLRAGKTVLHRDFESLDILIRSE